MINRTGLHFALAVAAVCAFSAASLAAEPAAEPPMMPGYPNQPAATPTVKLTPDQIRAGNAIGSEVRNPDGAVIAKIADLYVNRKDSAVELASLVPDNSPAFKNGRTTVAWTSLRFQGKPTPHFVTALSTQALVNGTAFKQQAVDEKSYYDVKADLLGKQALGANGKNIGKIGDVVFNFENGRLDALIIDTGGLLDVGLRNRVVGWAKADVSGGEGGAPLRFAISKKEVDSAPVITTMAPMPVPNQSGSSTPMIREDSTGNISGTRIPVPQSRR